jgi:CMP-N-acetylneuraminic acid synthetase
VKTVAIIPIKLNSQRVKGKNFRLVNGIPLYQYLLSKLKDCNFDEIYVDSDSEEIKVYCKKMGYHFISRLDRLKLDSSNGNDLLSYHSEIIDADYYFQLFVTAPLLSTESINNCIRILHESKVNDSIFTVTHHHTWFWFNNKPVNYDPKVLPRSQDALPLISETTGLYGVRKKNEKPINCRIGDNPYMYKVNNIEAIDLDTEFDFNYLEYYVSNNLHRTK